MTVFGTTSPAWEVEVRRDRQRLPTRVHGREAVLARTDDRHVERDRCGVGGNPASTGHRHLDDAPRRDSAPAGPDAVDRGVRLTGVEHPSGPHATERRGGPGAGGEPSRDVDDEVGGGVGVHTHVAATELRDDHVGNHVGGPVVEVQSDWNAPATGEERGEPVPQCVDDGHVERGRGRVRQGTPPWPATSTRVTTPAARTPSPSPVPSTVELAARESYRRAGRSARKRAPFGEGAVHIDDQMGGGVGEHAHSAAVVEIGDDRVRHHVAGVVVEIAGGGHGTAAREHGDETVTLRSHGRHVEGHGACVGGHMTPTGHLERGDRTCPRSATARELAVDRRIRRGARPAAGRARASRTGQPPRADR